MVKISVTVPVYNVEKYLPRCLDTIVDQTFVGDYEIICVDDGSTDNSGKILDEYAKKYANIKVIHQENLGLSEARNTALKFVNGKYTMFVDSDDFIAKNTLESLYDFARKHNSDVVIFDFLRGTSEGKVLSTMHYTPIIKKYGKETFNYQTAETFVYRFVPVATWAKFYSTELIKNIKFEKNLNNQDVPHWAEVYTKAQRVNYLPIPFYFYAVQRVDGITMNKNRKVYDVFKAFSLAEDILKNANVFEKFKNIHYAHLTCNLVVILQKINPELRNEIINKIKKYNIDIDYEKFNNDDFFPFEKKNMNIIKFIKEHSFEQVNNFMVQENLWS
jgi:glycosyltransferase involved in cell wall biosynthesis